MASPTWLVADIETVGRADVADYLDDLTPRANLVDPVKIAADLAEKKAAALTNAALDWNANRLVAIGLQTEEDDAPHVLLCRDEFDEVAALEQVDYRTTFILDLLPLAPDYARTEDTAFGIGLLQRLEPDLVRVAGSQVLRARDRGLAGARRIAREGFDAGADGGAELLHAPRERARETRTPEAQLVAAADVLVGQVRGFCLDDPVELLEGRGGHGGYRSVKRFAASCALAPGAWPILPVRAPRLPMPLCCSARWESESPPRRA